MKEEKEETKEKEKEEDEEEKKEEEEENSVCKWRQEKILSDQLTVIISRLVCIIKRRVFNNNYHAYTGHLL